MKSSKLQNKESSEIADAIEPHDLASLMTDEQMDRFVDALVELYNKKNTNS